MKTYDEISRNVLEKRDEYLCKQRAKRKKLTQMSTAAVCLMLVAGISYGFSLENRLTTQQAGNTTTNKTGMTVTNPATTKKATDNLTQATQPTTFPATKNDMESVVMPHWEDLYISEKFREIKLGDITYSSQVNEIDEEHLLSFISEEKMSGYDIYEDKTYYENGRIYSIRHINPKCAVAVQIGEDKAYYVFVNYMYEPETLGEFMNDIDFKNTVVFGEAYDESYEFTEAYSKYTTKIYENFDDSIIWNMLLSDPTVKNTEYNHPYDRISISTDLPILGYKNISFSVTTDGYIITNILGIQKCFFVGKDKTDAFAEYLEENIAFKVQTQVYEHNPDGSIPGKEESFVTTPTTSSPARPPQTYEGSLTTEGYTVVATAPEEVFTTNWVCGTELE